MSFEDIKYIVVMEEFNFLAIILVHLCIGESLYHTDCPPNHFKLKGMMNCHPLLTCKDLESITVIKRIGKGAVKEVFLTKWKEFSMVLSLPADPRYNEDFINGVENIKILNNNKHIVQYLGYCDDKKALFTEYHDRGNAAIFFEQESLNISLCQGLGFCFQYSEILKFLHNSPAGRRVFCDSNSLEKLLSQLLITSETLIILNDVDALPEVINNSSIKCGHRQLGGAFVAPEQVWTKSATFRDDLMPGYNEKTDIWKAADVCNYFLKKSRNGEIVKYRLFNLHQKCKNPDPEVRPSAIDLVNEYNSVIKEYCSHTEL